MADTRVSVNGSSSDKDEPGTEYQRLAGPAYHGSFVVRYDALRARPPSDLIELLSDLAPRHPPQLVVDLGCGNGISTVAWAGLAERALGILWGA
jgi:hypothetical protein